MYAKWIHPQKLVFAEGDILRCHGRIIVHPTHEHYKSAGYYPVIVKEKQSLDNKDNIYIVQNQTIVILDEEKE